MPPRSFDMPTSIRCCRVSAFLGEMTQQIHSFRASGVISSHTAKAFGSEVRAFCKSGGILCKVSFFVIRLGIKSFARFAITWERREKGMTPIPTKTPRASGVFLFEKKATFLKVALEIVRGNSSKLSVGFYGIRELRIDPS